MRDFNERRRHSRHAIKLQATVVMSDELVRLPAAIVNLSHSGAMLELTNKAPLTGSMTLLFEHTLQPCTLVWQQASLAGLRFDELEPPAELDLRKYSQKTIVRRKLAKISDTAGGRTANSLKAANSRRLIGDPMLDLSKMQSDTR